MTGAGPPRLHLKEPEKPSFFFGTYLCGGEGSTRPHSLVDDSALSRQMRSLNIGTGDGYAAASTSSSDRPEGYEPASTSSSDRPPYSSPYSVYSPGLQSPVPRHRHGGEYHRPSGDGRSFDHDYSGGIHGISPSVYYPGLQSPAPRHRHDRGDQDRRPNGRSPFFRASGSGGTGQTSYPWTGNGHSYRSTAVRDHRSQVYVSDLPIDSPSPLWLSGYGAGPSPQQVTAYPSVSSLRGRILDYACDRERCKQLQRTIEQGLNAEEVEILFREIRYHLVYLMTDRYANYIVQQFLEVCTEDHRNFVVGELTAEPAPPIARIALHQQGTRVIQKLLETTNTQRQRHLLSRAIFRYTVELSKSSHGQHVILHCLERFSDEDNQLLYSEVANNCRAIASDKLGCCVIQKCLESAGKNKKEMLAGAVIGEAYYLSMNAYGNYVVQHVVQKCRMPGAIPGLISQLKGEFGYLSCDKYGSHVVECCLRESGTEQFVMIVTDLLEDRNRMQVFLDEFGNYVFTTAVQLSEKKGVDYIFRTLQAIIQQNARLMSCHSYGSKALARLEKNNLLLRETVAALRLF